jgi:hypothetical protein
MRYHGTIVSRGRIVPLSSSYFQPALLRLIHADRRGVSVNRAVGIVQGLVRFDLIVVAVPTVRSQMISPHAQLDAVGIVSAFPESQIRGGLSYSSHRPTFKK